MNNIIRMDRQGNRQQIATDLTFKEAYVQVMDLRSRKDGNYYWIGKL